MHKISFLKNQQILWHKKNFTYILEEDLTSTKLLIKQKIFLNPGALFLVSNLLPINHFWLKLGLIQKSLVTESLNFNLDRRIALYSMIRIIKGQKKNSQDAVWSLVSSGHLYQSGGFLGVMSDFVDL